jgi:hypothetical protein
VDSVLKRFPTTPPATTTLRSDLKRLLLSRTSEGSTAVGSFALSNDISVNGENTATGWSALRFNTTGVGNTATGQEALLSNTTGFDNTAMGEGVLEFNNGAVVPGAGNLWSGRQGRWSPL